MLVQQQREPKSQRELHDAGHRGVKKGVVHREPENAIGQQELVVLNADPTAGAADLGIRKSEPDAQAERISQKKNKQRRSGKHEYGAQDIAAIEKARDGHGKAVKALNVLNA